MSEITEDALGCAAHRDCPWWQKAKQMVFHERERAASLDRECKASMAEIAAERERAERAEAHIERLEAALTPSADTKASHIGEFHFTEEELDDEGNYVTRRRTVPWTTVKEIMSAIRAHAALEDGTIPVDKPDEVAGTKAYREGVSIDNGGDPEVP